MAGQKYDNLIITNTKRPNIPPWVAELPRDPDTQRCVLWLDSSVFPGASYMECYWIFKPTAPGGGHPTHVHDDWDEVLAFFGSDPKDLTDLHAEVNLWLDDEKYVITKSCVVFIPRGLKHCPLRYARVDRPFFHFTTGHRESYLNEKDYRILPSPV